MDNVEIFKQMMGSEAHKLVLQQGVHELYLLVRPHTSNLRMDSGKKTINYFTTPEAILNGNAGIRPFPLFKPGDFIFDLRLNWAVVFGRNSTKGEEDGEKTLDIQGAVGQVGDPVLRETLKHVAISYFMSDGFKRDIEMAADADRRTREHHKGKVKVQLFGFDIPDITASQEHFVEAICKTLAKQQ